ncbi:hypothetical protein AB0878_38570 [Amycolatopsis sp. NPDC047767]|uniref:hypothetical protein n=1 Tax=Amycolatopsis sp. NPDC047767 TaxID=3156765 RepID=UPI003452C1B8
MTHDDTNTLRRLAGLATPMALRVAVTLGLPARLLSAAGPSELAAELGVNPSRSASCSTTSRRSASSSTPPPATAPPLTATTSATTSPRRSST